MRADYHVHCEFSDDSSEPMENQIERGIELGLDEICFTDHVDYGIKSDFGDPVQLYRRKDGSITTEVTDEPMNNVNYPVYFDKLDKMREKYGKQITIKNGLEFGVQTITIPQFSKLYETYKEKLDFTLLSMHQVDNLEFWTQEFQKGRTQQEYNEKYYQEILAVQNEFKGYSVLAHLDLLARYDELGIYPFEKVEDIIAAILKQAISDNKGIEVNTSSFHYGLKDTQPSRAILRLYKDLGGKIITVGSDAHSTKYVADHLDDVYTILKNEIGFTEFCTFDHMQPVFHRL